MKKSALPLALAITVLVLSSIPVSKVNAMVTETIHVRLYPYHSSDTAPSFSEPSPGNLVVDVPIFKNSKAIHVHDAPSGIGLRDATGLNAALGEYMIPASYSDTYTWFMTTMPRYGFQQSSSDSNSVEFTSNSTSNVVVDLTFWDFDSKQTLVQYWVTEVVPQKTAGPSLLFPIAIILLAAMFSLSKANRCKVS